METLLGKYCTSHISVSSRIMTHFKSNHSIHILRNLYQFVEDWSFLIADYQKMKDYYVPDFERNWFKHENQDKFKGLKDSKSNSLLKTHLKKADMHMFVAAIEELLDLQFSVEDVLVDSFRRRNSTSTKKISLAPKDS